MLRRRFRKPIGLWAIVLTTASLAVAASKLTISPSNPEQLSNSALQFNALVNGELIDGPVKWTSSNPAVATITGTTGTGSASLLSAGSTTITAVHGGQKVSTVLTVTVAVSPVFTVQPSNANVSAVINAGTGIQVQLLDNLGDPLPNQAITISIGTNAADGGGAVQNAQGTLSGTLTQTTNSSGIATFADLKIDWLGNGYTLVASASPSSGAVSGTSNSFNELRVGDACLGPTQPACSSGCPDSDLDGLNDAWEKAGGVDLNGDGVITDSYHDVLLPGADPNKPDIYVKYDYMVAPTHSHNPPAGTWDQMTAMFAAHGITLHVLAPTAGITEHQVTTLDPNATAACAGNDFITTQKLRSLYFGNLRPAYHYMVFAHDSTTPHNGSLVAACPTDALCGAKPSAGATGVSDILGDDSIISFGAYVDSNTQIGIELWASTTMHELGHNFGLVHGSLADPGNAAQECLNFKPNYISVMNYTYQLDTLVPATAPGGITPISCTKDADCGPPSITNGRCSTPSTCFCTDDLGPGNNVCYRPDYAEDNLLNLNETALDENVGVGGRPDLDDIVWYFNLGGTLPGPSNGSPIDWDNNGLIQNLDTCVNALPPGQGPNGHCPDINNDGLNNDQMDTTADWTQVNGQFIHFNFQYQCTAGYQNDVSGSHAPVLPQPTMATASSSNEDGEVSFEWARQHHLLHPPSFISISVSPGCSSGVKPVVAGQMGRARVALLGAANFDVTQVDTSSLAFHGAKALSVVTEDVNHNGIPDLVATFDGAEVKLHPQATVARLTGWMKNGQSFSGEDNKIRVVPSLSGEDPTCR
jgi:hypothetical protein